MSDPLGEALARWDENHPARPMTTFYYSQLVAAARNWQYVEQHYPQVAMAVVDALTDTAEEDA